MIKFGNFIVTDNNSWLSESSSPGPTPPTPVLPAGTVRVRTSDGNAPIKNEATLIENRTSYETATLVSGTNDVYDVYKSGDSFYNLLRSSTNVTEVLGANTTGITNMRNMFSGCSSLTSVVLFDTSSVTNMNGMFASCRSLTTVPLFDTSSVTDMGYMFDYCSTLANVPLFDTSSVTNMNGMFSFCTLTTVPLFNTSSCEDMRNMFYYCRSLTSVPLFNTSNVTNMNSMFMECTSLTSVPLFNTSSVTNMDWMFTDCVNVQSGALALYQQASTQTTPPSSHSNTFYLCGSNTTTGTAELAQIPATWGGSGS